MEDKVQEMKNKVLFWKPTVTFAEHFGFQDKPYKRIYIEIDVFNYHINWVVEKGGYEKYFFDDYGKAIEWYLED